MTKEEMAQKIAEAIERGDSDLRGAVDVLEHNPTVVCVETNAGEVFFLEVKR